MALSFARPDPSSPADVSTATFSSSRKGFDSEEVREFLRMVAAELARLQDREATLEKELKAAQQVPAVSLADLDKDVVKGMANEEAARILATAREAASQMKIRAEESSSRLLNEANEEAQRVRAEAEVEAGRRRQDAALVAEDELQMAKQQGRDMVNEARAYRERVLGELSRRRELARKQIEQLIQNRDRLMQSFDKSRLIAIDVMAEMAPSAASSELVDLSPVTGPVPVIAPARELNVPKPTPAPAPVVVAEPTPPPASVEPVVEVKAEAEPPAPPLDERETAVDDLFARLRAATEVTAVKPKPKAKSAGKASPKGKAKTKAAATTHDQLSVFQASPSEPEALVATLDSPFGRRDAQLAPLIAAGSRNLKRVLADEQNDVLQLLRGREAVRSLMKVLPDSGAHTRRYSDAIAEELMHAAVAGAAGVDDASADDQRAAITREAALEPAIDALAVAIVSPLRDRLERSIAAADGDNVELVGLTRTIYREWKTRRIDEHLDHIVHLAFGRGVLAVLRPGTPVCWAVDPTGKACPDAEDNALAGAVGAGDKFPTEHVFAPAHEGCRCMLLPVAR